MRQLRALLAHAVEAVPHYQQDPYRAWLKAEPTAAWSAFRELPILTRKEVQRCGENLRATTLPAYHGDPVENETSGSTGIPLRFWSTPLLQAISNAIVMREHIWHQRDFSLRHAFLRSWLESPLTSGWGPPTSVLFDCGEMAAKSSRSTTPEQQAAWLTEIDPHYLLTQPVNVRALARLALSGRLRLTNLREVRTIGETVTDGLRELVRSAWGAEVVDIYSAAEYGTLALQCPVSGGYHVQSEAAIFEVLDATGKPCGAGTSGRIVATPLHNFATPLVRYDMGDYAEVAGPCPCGRGLPHLKRILGRRRNRLHLPDGTTTWPQLSSLSWIELAPTIERFQLRQAADLSLSFEYEAPDVLPPEDCLNIRDKIDFLLGCRLPLGFRRVESLPTGQAGKLEDFVSFVEDEPEQVS